MGCHNEMCFISKAIFPIESINVYPFASKLNIGWASLVFMHKANWYPIPNELLIHLGEEWIVQYNRIKHSREPLVIDGFRLSAFDDWCMTTRLPQFQDLYIKEHTMHDWVALTIKEL
jgi:hypothetical protein